MSRMRKRYSNGQSRGGVKGVCVDSGRKETKKDYHRQEVAFHGSEMAYNNWADKGMKGYR